MEFQTYCKVNEDDSSALLAAMQWLSINYGTKLHQAQAIGQSNVLTFTIIETLYVDAVATLTDMVSHFDTKLIVYNLVMSQSSG